MPKSHGKTQLGTFILIVLLVPFLFNGSLWADKDKAQEELSLEDLLNTKVDTAAKYKQYINEAAASITVITSEEIDRFGYRSLEEVFMSVPGFYISNDRNYFYLGTRGFSRPSDYNNRILMLLNGHSINEGFYGSASFGSEMSLNIKMVDRIEIVRGPGSALYGTGAMFGVINIITKKGSQANNRNLGIEGASHGRIEGGLTYGKKFQSGLDVFVSGMLRNVQGPNLYFPEFDDPSTNYGLAEGIDWDRSFGFQSQISYKNFIFQGVLFGRDKGIPTAPWEGDFNDDRMKTYDAMGFLELKYSKDFGPDKNLMARAYYNNYYYEGGFPYDGSLEFDQNKGQWSGGEATFRWDISASNRVIAGIEYQDHFQSYYKYWGEEEVYMELDAPFRIYSLFLQDEFQITNKLSLMAGIRGDDYSNAGSSISPRIGAVFHLFNKSTLKALYGEAFRAPSAYEVNYDDEVSGYKPNFNLRPEKIRTIELSWDQRFNQYLMGYATVFNYRMKDLIDWDIDPADEFYQAMNINIVDAWGVELGFNVKHESGILAYGNYTYQNAKDNDTGLRLTNSPTHLIKAGISFPFLKKYFVSAQVLHESERITVFETKTDPFFLVDLTLSSGRLFNHLKASFKVRNLFDSEYSFPGGWEHSLPAIPQNGRSITLRIEYLY